MRARRRPKSMMSRLVASLAALAVAVGVAAGVAACAPRHARRPPPRPTPACRWRRRRPRRWPPGTASRGQGVRRSRPPGVRVGQQNLRARRQRGRPDGHAARDPDREDDERNDGDRGDADRRTTPGSPAWSPDGRWLAFLVGTPSADGAVTSGALWLAGPDGQDAHQVLPKVAGFAWSPTADELAATSGPAGSCSRCSPGSRRTRCSRCPASSTAPRPGRRTGARSRSPPSTVTADQALRQQRHRPLRAERGDRGQQPRLLPDGRADHRRLVGERRRACWPGPTRGDAASTPGRRAAARLLPARRRADGDAGKHPGLPLVRGAGRGRRDAGDR